MNAKKKLLFSFAGLILSIVIFSTVVFAWFAITSTTSDFVVETGYIKSNATLYYGNWDGSTYTWEEVKNKDTANNIFKKIIPGQIITFKLVLLNDSTSTVDINYDVSFGGLLYNSDINASDDYVLPEVEKETDIHLFNAIYFGIKEDTSTMTDTEVNQLFKPSTTGENRFKPDAQMSKLSSYIDNLTICSPQDAYLEPGESANYILKFYFNPLFVDPTEESNVFANKGFKIDTIICNFYQRQQIIEKNDIND